MQSLLPDLAGYSVIGRHGYLGTVVAVAAAADRGERSIVFRGGVSDSLLFHVPAGRIRSVSEHERTLTLEVDVGDFAPRLGEGGTVELHLSH